jgi:hypothetical protein
MTHHPGAKWWVADPPYGLLTTDSPGNSPSRTPPPGRSRGCARRCSVRRPGERISGRVAHQDRRPQRVVAEVDDVGQLAVLPVRIRALVGLIRTIKHCIRESGREGLTMCPRCAEVPNSQKLSGASVRLGRCFARIPRKYTSRIRLSIKGPLTSVSWVRPGLHIAMPTRIREVAETLPADNGTGWLCETPQINGQDSDKGTGVVSGSHPLPRRFQEPRRPDQ